MVLQLMTVSIHKVTKLKKSASSDADFFIAVNAFVGFFKRSLKSTLILGAKKDFNVLGLYNNFN
ncbi:hypothetical protein SAMN04487999_1849 [Leeuwenhoekiella palythoae]|uniref:Uncharacterized protein n=1 Tax=Leeuwenhoekiella palythoae TaxID=573501 RepID=A0A1M5Y0P6_9FLAO|nr:hypothetical protein SAMN04487999_1849 [Leeuwenhoekiella palythoae]